MTGRGWWRAWFIEFIFIHWRVHSDLGELSRRGDIGIDRRDSQREWHHHTVDTAVILKIQLLGNYADHCRDAGDTPDKQARLHVEIQTLTPVVRGCTP